MATQIIVSPPPHLELSDTRGTGKQRFVELQGRFPSLFDIDELSFMAAISSVRVRGIHFQILQCRREPELRSLLNGS